MKRLSINIALIPILVLTWSLSAVAGSPQWSRPYRDGVLIFKVVPSHKVELPARGAARFGETELDRLMDAIQATKVEPAFPDCLPAEPGKTDLSLIYNLYFPESLPVEAVCLDLLKSSAIQYAEPRFLYSLCYEPDDPKRDEQYGLALCQAYDAFDLSTGDPSAVVGIVDTGVDFNHSDLKANRWVNPGEDLDGDGVISNDEKNEQDDDQNGKVDDFYGWDFYNDDNTVSGTNPHGTHVAGIASAATDNGRGIASVGFSCSIMAVRTDNPETGYVEWGYEGIVYAVRSHALVVNLSWGGPWSSHAAEDVIDDAYNHDVLVVAGAGNAGVDSMFYPAGYVNAVAVAGTDSRDRKADFSNYGDWIDVCAPGVDVLSTVPGGGYEAWNGTSMASPFAASVAILIRAAIPDADVDSVRRLLLEGADNIDDLNRGYEGELGSGRINAFNSLSLGMRPDLRVQELQLVSDGNQNGRLDPGETDNLAITIANGQHALPAENISVTLSSSDTSVSIDHPSFFLNRLERDASYTNERSPFEVTVNASAIAHTTSFTITIDADPGIALEQRFDEVIGVPDILLVDDDGGAVAESLYYQSLDSVRMGWVRWDALNNFAPEVSLMLEHPMVIWFTGSSDPALDDFERFQLEEALNGGANVLLCGQYIGDEEANRSLLTNQFGARHQVSDVSAQLVQGLNGNRPVGSDLELTLDEGVIVSPSSMTPVLDADSLLIYRNGNGEVTGTAGVYRKNNQTGSKTVHLGFPLENTRDAGPGTPRYEFLRQIHAWFLNIQSVSREQSGPGTFALYPAYPNPFNGTVRISFNLPRMTAYRVWVTDLEGRDVTLLSSGFLGSGGNSVIWSPGSLPSGLYVAHLETPAGGVLSQRLVLLK